MKKSLDIALVGVGNFFVTVLIFGIGLYIGQSNVFANSSTTNGFRTQTPNYPGYSMMGG